MKVNQSISPENVALFFAVPWGVPPWFASSNLTIGVGEAIVTIVRGDWKEKVTADR